MSIIDFYWLAMIENVGPGIALDKNHRTQANVQ
jgi:hypothetical protein